MTPKSRKIRPVWGFIVLFTRFADLSALTKEEAIERLSSLEARVSLSERKAGMGSFRWTLGDDMPAWSPGLFSASTRKSRASPTASSRSPMRTTRRSSRPRSTAW